MAAGGRGKSTRGRGRGRGSEVGGSSQSSNPNSATQSVTQSKSRRPSQYPPSTKSQKTPTQTTKTPTPPLQHSPSVSEQPPLVRRKQLPALRQHQVPPLQEQPVETPIPEQQFIPLHQNPNYEEEDEVDDGEEVGDKEPIPGVETLWFNRHNGKLSRVISGIFRRKFDGPYISWKVTPIATQERYFRNFARKYYWDQGVTELVKEGSLVIAKKRMKGIVSQAKKSGEQPPWIGDTLWKQMWCIGTLKMLSRRVRQLQTVETQIVEEEKLKRRVSYGEVFMKTHIRADGSFVDQKSQHVGEAYVKMLEEMMFEIDEDGPQISDGKGNPFGLGSLGETLNKRRKTETYASSSSTVAKLQEQLQLKMSEQAEQNAKHSTEPEPVTLPTTTLPTATANQPTNTEAGTQETTD
ncbi:hypothetical protein AXX17_AT2G07250 [Arabidopsis thaliana]|uniref:Uncharacterized protein n=1 Tax=Arabidopsis thaliana TaxID=3702 RepID=A0A178VRA8_ARATH|nr:hypothetical protein AXX17_AT2G07250 [Arabidopsis thaliana]